MRLKAKWLAQLAKMVCATGQNDVRTISDVTDVLGKMMCALMCALVCAPVAEVPVAQRISFSSDEQSMYAKYYRPALWGRSDRNCGGAALAILQAQRLPAQASHERKTWRRLSMAYS
jgi:hypothetical protein